MTRLPVTIVHDGKHLPPAAVGHPLVRCFESRSRIVVVPMCQGASKDADAKAKVLANWQRVETMKKEYPEFAINWQPVFRTPVPGGDAKRVMGRPPDAPLSGRVLRELRAPGLE